MAICAGECIGYSSRKGLSTILTEWVMDEWPLEKAGGTEVAGGAMRLDGMVMAMSAEGRENEIEKRADKLAGSARVESMKDV